jgi:hypothetical protein
MLQDYQIKNMVCQFVAQNKIDDKQKYLEIGSKLSKLINELDIKEEKTCLIWLLKQVYSNQIRDIEEDFDFVKHDLVLYFENKGAINKELKNIEYSHLKQLVQPYREDGLEYNFLQFLSKPIAQGKQYKVYKIDDVNILMRVGKGTSWCIQGETFAKRYLEHGSLYLATKNEHRFALFDHEYRQIMNIDDRPLKDEVIKEIFSVWPESKKIIEENYILKYIDEQTEEVCSKAVEKNAENLKYTKNQTDELCLNAIKKSAHYILYVKNANLKLQREAIKRNCFSIKSIKNPDEQIQLEAIKLYTNNKNLKLSDLTEQFKIKLIEEDADSVFLFSVKSKEMKIAAIKKDFIHFNEFVDIRDELDFEYFRKIFTEQPDKICYFIDPPKKFFLEVIRIRPETIQYLLHRDDELQLEAIKVYTKNENLKIEDLTDQFKLDLLKKDGLAIKIIFDTTEEMMRAAVNQNLEALTYVGLRKKELLEFIKKDFRATKYCRFDSSMTEVMDYIVSYLKKCDIKTRLNLIIENNLYFEQVRNLLDEDEQIKIEYIKKFPYSISVFKNVSEQAQIEAVKVDPFCVLEIKNPSKRVRLEATKSFLRKNKIDEFNFEEFTEQDFNEDLMIQLINKTKISAAFFNKEDFGKKIQFSEQIQLAMIKRNYSELKYIKNPSEAVQLEAVKQHVDSIRYIKNPSQAVLDYVEEFLS